MSIPQESEYVFYIFKSICSSLGMSYFSTYFLEIKLDIKWITILNEMYYLLKAIQDQGRFLPPHSAQTINDYSGIWMV
jgi:hypothetical protein